ncbi:disulfide bond formation protein B [Marinicauda salina]|uniref:Disulfide bond formation protein B n=1 Tax=Marinicauda salina TaxID=2135793 RepID=A0A2U2BS82_9PROT|nr:disulfide bond formation protein B [Marinicauda salina]PWE16864.1 disulfide bond formation protein B [Marinicauda salina]
MTDAAAFLRTQSAPTRWPLWGAFASIALLLGALGFEFIGGYPPCPMCYVQRWIHVAAAVLGLGLVGAYAFAPETRRYARWGAAALGLVFVGSALYAARHAGIEYGLIEGPASCTASGGSPNFSLDDLNAALGAGQRVVLCDEIAWSLFGISMAGWNALISAGLAAVSFVAASRREEAPA